MVCPYCRHPDSRVVDSRTSDDGAAIRRRRQCTECGRRFSTVETTSVSVIKRSGVTEPFHRQKIISGVRKACQGRPVSQDDLAKLAQEVEERIRARGLAEIDAHEVGLTILEPLSKLDTVAYLRFASVYQAFDNLEDFEKAIADLRKDQVDAPESDEDEPSDAWVAPNASGAAASSQDVAGRNSTPGGASVSDAQTPEQTTLL